MLDKVEISGYIVLSIGVILLVFTFYNAYFFLSGVLEIGVSKDLLEAFGGALAPLVETCINAIYLGIMGWISSIIAMRGIQLLTREKRESRTEARPRSGAEKPS